jgi:hypothetical protein
MKQYLPKMRTRLLLFGLLFSANIFAQKIITDGTLTYKISIETTKGEKQLSSALNDATLNLFLSKEKSRTEMQSKPGIETTVFDTKAGKGFILKEYSGQKLMITTTKENWAQKNQISSNLSFTISSETTTIAGYTCKKATAVSADGKTYTVYFDPTITIANKTYNNAFSLLEGMPVQYELKSGNLVQKYTLINYITDVLPVVKFDAPKVGFRVMSYEETQQLKKVE